MTTAAPTRRALHTGLPLQTSSSRTVSPVSAAEQDDYERFCWRWGYRTTDSGAPGHFHRYQAQRAEAERRRAAEQNDD
jgi:hypothetical protein